MGKKVSLKINYFRFGVDWDQLFFEIFFLEIFSSTDVKKIEKS